MMCLIQVNNIIHQICDEELPGPPANARAIDVTPTTIELAIDLPKDSGGVDVFGYSVQYDLRIMEFIIGKCCIFI